MNQRPEEIKFLLNYKSVATFKEIDPWIIKFEMAQDSTEKVIKVIQECKDYFKERFDQIFDESALNKLTENYHDICLWELQESLKYD